MKKLSLIMLCFAFGCLLVAMRADETTTAAAVPPSALPEVNHLVYLSELPESADLMASAEANGLTVTRLDRTSERVVVVYRYPDGQTAAVGYALLSTAGKSHRVQPASSAVYMQTKTVVTPEPEIIYVDRTPRTRVVYRDYRDDFWLPLTIGLGLGYYTGHHNHYRSYRGHYTSYRGHRGYGGHGRR